MNDIRLCTGGDCEHRTSCARYTTAPCAGQTWLPSPPYYIAANGWVCHEYVENPPEAA